MARLNSFGTCVFCQVQKDENTAVIEVNDGHLRGNVKTSRTFQKCYSFSGVPFLKTTIQIQSKNMYSKVLQCIGFFT